MQAGSLDRAALRAGTATIMRAIAALLPPEQRGRWDPGVLQPVGSGAVDAVAQVGDAV
jgi:hypothetical protein